jgi:hypothetical protein
LHGIPRVNTDKILRGFGGWRNMIENNTVPVKINDKLSAEINGIVRKVIRLNKRGIRIVLTDINNILNGLNKTK